jgi:CBS domain-containing protein
LAAVISSPSTVTDAVVSFLRSIPPFQFLPQADLRALASKMTLEYFPKDTVILRAGERPPDALYAIQKGAVKLALRTKVGKELIFEMLSEGDLFGLLSLMSRDVTRLDVTAVEDTLCYAIPAADVHRLLAQHAEVADYLLRKSVTRYMDRSLNELRAQTNLMGGAERLLYSLAVKDVVTKPALVCSRWTSIRDAAKIMSEANATCIFATGEDHRALGIASDKDFTHKVVARGLELELPMDRIMTSPVIAVESNQRVFQALVAMLTHNIHHLLVTEEGLPKGVLTSHDLMLLQGKSPLSVARHIEQQKSLEDLAAAQKRISELLPLLMREGAKASHITRVVAEMNDRVTCKILELAQAELGPAPVPFCWVVLGSEGRREQTFKTDQDNALIYDDTTGENAAAAKEYFGKLAGFAHDALVRCGYASCEGGYMARNPRWRQPLSSWLAYFEAWIMEADRRSVEDALILFDMRPVAGDISLFERVAARKHELIRDAALFKSVLAFISTQHKPPLGFFRTFVVERSGEHKAELDLKLFGTGPIVNAARLLALDAGIEQTNTVDRISALQHVDEVLQKDLQEAFEFLTLLRLEHQLQQAHSGQPLSNYIRPERLTHLQRSLLKEAFQAIGRVQSVIDERFRTAVWSQLGR